MNPDLKSDFLYS